MQDSLPRMLARSRTQVPERVRDYNLGSSSGPRQPRIDTGPWTDKGRNAKSKIGRAWSKFCHAAGIPGRKVDDPYFKAAFVGFLGYPQPGGGTHPPIPREGVLGKVLGDWADLALR